MIEVLNGWKIDTYDGGYLAFNKTSTQFDKKTGKERQVPQNPNYFSSLSNALNYIANQCAKERVGSHRKDITLDKAIADIKEVYDEFAKVLAPLKKLEDYEFVKESKK